MLHQIQKGSKSKFRVESRITNYRNTDESRLNLTKLTHSELDSNEIPVVCSFVHRMGG